MKTPKIKKTDKLLKSDDNTNIQLNKKPFELPTEVGDSKIQTKKSVSHSTISTIKVQHLLLNDKNYQNIFDGMKEFYNPLLKCFGSYDKFNKTSKNILPFIMNYLNSKSVFNNEKEENNEEFPYSKKKIKIIIIEIILISFLVFLYQILHGFYSEFFDELDNEGIYSLYEKLRKCLMCIKEFLMFLTLYNSTIKPKDGNELLLNIINYCFKNDSKPTNIIETCERINISYQQLKTQIIELSRIISNYFYQNINSFPLVQNFPELANQISYYKKIILYLKNTKSGLSYEELKNDLSKTILFYINKNILPPYLPPINPKFKYTLVIDLDETLIHCIENRDTPFVIVRPYVNYFLKEMSKVFEIVIFTAGEEKYAEPIIKELDKGHCISHRLYRKHTSQNSNGICKDLSKLGRDIKRICIIDNTSQCFALQPENGLEIISFIGNENDNELLLLSKDLLVLANENKDDIRESLGLVRKKMQLRYK